MTKIREMLELAHRKGYRVTAEGQVVNAMNRVRKLVVRTIRNDARYVFNIAAEKRARYPIPVHKLQAYQLFGEAMFEPGIVARHLDGNAFNNTPDNIALGTVRDNIMDRSPEDRRAHAALASSYIVRRDWSDIEKDHFENLLGFKKLSAKHGVSVGALSKHFNQLPGWKPIGSGVNWDDITDYIRKTGCDYYEVARIFGIAERSCRRKLGLRQNFK